MDIARPPLHWAETSAVLYLITPLFIFFAFFVRLEIAVLTCPLIAFLGYDVVRRTSWREFLALRWESLYFLLLAGIWMWLAGGTGPLVLAQNGDWEKHNTIITLLAERPWPTTYDFQNLGNLALRYYIGWHLVPSVIMKAFPALSPEVAASIWSVLGLFLFFSLLPDLVGKRSIVMAAAPLAFIVFGGADIIGAQITHYYSEINHFEWWAGWAQFSSNTTALFWCPQQALPAWLAAALLMRCRHAESLLPYCALLASATLLWSPFVAIGLLPFLLALTVQHGPRIIAFGWRALLSVLLVALPVGLYMIAGSAVIPHGYIGNFPCTVEACFTWSAYLLFLAIEIGAPLTLLLLRKQSERGFLLAAAGALCLLPLYKMGVFNDLVMRASLPSLAVLAILCGKLFSAPRPYPIAAFAVLLLALPSVFGELSRGFFADPKPRMMDLDVIDETQKWWVDQTFAPPRIWVLRESAAEP